MSTRKIIRKGSPPATANYTYDAWARLKTAQTTGDTAYPAWGLSFTYDRYGNRTAQSVTTGSAPANSLSFSTTGGALTNHADTFSYDASGNMLNDGTNTLTYDAENRTLTSAGTLGSATYTYDGNGLRVEKSGSNGSTIYIFSGAKVIGEYAPGAQPSSPTTEYIYAGANLVASITSGTPTYYHPDQLSARALTSSTGSVLGQQGHYPFGESWYASGTATKWKFTSYERDPESANDYAMARYDVNRLGRFSSPDPMPGSIADPQSLDAYSYVQNDPVNFVDPLGLDPCTGYVPPGTICVQTNLPYPTGAGGGAGVHQPLQSGTNNISVGGGGGVNFGHLIGQAIVALTNPKCAALFGGFQKAIAALVSSTFNMYSPGDTNPYPSLIPAQTWTDRVSNLNGAYGFGFWSPVKPGGNVFFTSQFNSYDSGFPATPDGFAQMTGFFHEFEHVANQNNALDQALDANTASYAADYLKINANCASAVESPSSPIATTLTPP